jgi:hypothetical protein
MGYGLNTMLGGKVYLSRLAKAKGKCTALLNLPSIKQFTTSTDPYFCDTFTNGVDIKPAFDTKYIPLGGNDELYSTRSFSLPDEDNGAKFTAVFGPYLKYSVSGKSILVPPAADVANVLVRKFQGGDPYMICANLNGLLSNQYMTGVEYKFDLTDREYLEPMGINPIITRNGNVMIYGNQTTYQVVKSDFNKLHVRENLNTLEIEIEITLNNLIGCLVTINHHIAITSDNRIDTHWFKIFTVCQIKLVFYSCHVLVAQQTIQVSTNHVWVSTLELSDKNVSNICCGWH